MTSALGDQLESCIQH